MKASTALKKARIYYAKAESHIAPISSKIAAKLDDDGAHIVDQASDGLCVAYGNHSNASLALLPPIDDFLKLGKKEMLAALDVASI